MGAPAASLVCSRFTYIARDIVGLGFESCSSDCFGAFSTDCLLAVHAAYAAWRLVRRLRQQTRCTEAIAASALEPLTGPTGHGATESSRPWRFRDIALSLIISNSVWSFLGASYWLQPNAVRARLGVGFELLWRTHAQCQVALIYFAYLTMFTLVRIGNLSPLVTRHERLLSRLAAVHVIAFGLVCAHPSACDQKEYVLWGGINIMPPLLSQWLAFASLVRRHRLHKAGPSLHPLYGAVLSGIWFWIGNSQIFVGRECGLALWMRSLAGHLAGRASPFPSEYWEEMAIFHLFGLVGNDLLFRAYEWIALQEAAVDCQASSTSPRPSPSTSPPISPTCSPSAPASDAGSEDVGACPSTSDLLLATSVCGAGQGSTAAGSSSSGIGGGFSGGVTRRGAKGGGVLGAVAAAVRRDDPAWLAALLNATAARADKEGARRKPKLD